MTAATLIVMERAGDWAVSLRRELRDATCREDQSSGAAVSIDRRRIQFQLLESRSLDECWEQLRKRPAAVLAVELTEPLAPSILAALRRLEREYPRAEMLIMCDRRLSPYTSLLREAGAVHCITSPRRLGEAIELLRRHAARLPAVSQPPVEELAELPWST